MLATSSVAILLLMEGSFQALGGLLPGALALRSAYGVLCGGWQKGADRLICGLRTGLAGPSLETQTQEVFTTPVPSYITLVDCKCTAIVSSLIHHGAQTRSLGATPKGRQSSAALVVAE